LHRSGHMSRAPWAATNSARAMPAAFNTQNLRGQSLLFRCLVTGFVTTAPALTRYQQGRGIDPTERELVGERPSNCSAEAPTTVCEHCGMLVKGNQWAFRQHQQSKRCQKAQQAA
jgi:hypothetical protein